MRIQYGVCFGTRAVVASSMMCLVLSTVMVSPAMSFQERTKKPGKVEQPEVTARSVMPSGIRRHSEAFRLAWRQLSETIQKNGKLKRPLAEPYLARARLLSIAGDQESALQDYLDAIRAARSSGATVVDQARYLAVLHRAMEQRANAPEPLYTADAYQQYRAGRALFAQRRYSRALIRLDSAVKGDPKTALYLYYRGLTLKIMGREQDATHDIRRAVSLDVSRLVGDGVLVDRDEIRTFRARTFERIQGPLRTWLDGHFDGLLLAPRKSANSDSGN